MMNDDECACASTAMASWKPGDVWSTGAADKTFDLDGEDIVSEMMDLSIHNANGEDDPSSAVACRRMRAGRFLPSRSSVLAVEFSQYGRTIVVGNETGLITFFDVATYLNKAPETLYKKVVGIGGEVALKSTPDGSYIAVASGSTFVRLDASPPETSARFLARKVVQSGVGFASLTVSPDGRLALLADDRTGVLADGCSCARVLDRSDAVVWSKDGSHDLEQGRVPRPRVGR